MAKSFLDTLLGDHSLPVEEVPVARISPSPHQPRLMFDEDALNSLAESIRRVGLINPIVVRKKAGGYELVAGERRLRAHQLLGRRRIAAYVREMDEATTIEITLVENIQRESLTPMEEARAISRLMSLQQLNQTRAAQKVGRSPRQVATLLRLLSLDPVVQDFIHNGELAVAVGRVLADISDVALQREWADKALARRLSAEALAALLAAGPAEDTGAPPPPPVHRHYSSLRQVIERLKKAEGTHAVEERDLGAFVELVIRLPKPPAGEGL